MSTETAIILCVLILGALAIKWYGDWKQREITSRFFRDQVDKQIDARDEEIKKKSEYLKETAHEYFDRMAEYNRTRGNDGKSSVDPSPDEDVSRKTE